MKPLSYWLGLLLALFSSLCAASGQAGLSHVDIDVFNADSVRRGAGIYANYCMGCHSLGQMRYSRIQKDLNMSENTMRSEFMLGSVKIHDLIKSSMSAEDGESMFGVAPPDLSLVARSRGTDWIYSYLKGFYLDSARPLGVNNRVANNIAMPNVFWALQGSQEAVWGKEHGEAVITRLKLTHPGSLSSASFDATVTDLVTFLAYVAEPSQLQRLPMGKFVLFFLLILTVVFYRLKKEYWKNLH